MFWSVRQSNELFWFDVSRKTSNELMFWLTDGPKHQSFDWRTDQNIKWIDVLIWCFAKHQMNWCFDLMFRKTSNELMFWFDVLQNIKWIDVLIWCFAKHQIMNWCFAKHQRIDVLISKRQMNWRFVIRGFSNFRPTVISGTPIWWWRHVVTPACIGTAGVHVPQYRMGLTKSLLC
jgi:hypothetical protein